MKKRLIIFITLTMLILTSCSKGENTSAEQAENDKDINTERTVVTQAQIETKAEEFKEEYDFSPADLVCDLPEEFEESDYPGEFVPQKNKDDVSSINHVISDSTEDISLMTEEEFKETVEAEYYDNYGDEVTLNITQYEKIIVDKRPGLWIMYNFDFRSEHFEVLTVLLFNGTEVHNITYFQDTEADWMEAYIESAKSIGFVNK